MSKLIYNAAIKQIVLEFIQIIPFIQDNILKPIVDWIQKYGL